MKALSRLVTSRRGLPLLLSAAVSSLVVLGACSQTPVTVTLHSLQASGNLSFVCQADDGTGLKLDECPDYAYQHRRILGLVTQTATNEVALVDLRGEAVVDVDPTIPGYTFIRVGGVPGAIVSSPGGVASFVGVAGLNKNGVFALPTTCFEPPKAGQVARDLTSWAACSLSSAPGDIKLIIDPATLGDPANPMSRAACGSTEPESPPDQSGHADCPADLTQEAGPRGRRKLLVALPEEGRLVLLDAQSLLDRPPGEFQACTVEADYPLKASQPSTVTPVLPDDLQPDPAVASTCQTVKYPPASATAPTPGGMAVSGNQLYVSDRTLPVVHVLDVTDPCAPVEQDPLLPHSYLTPDRIVTTSKVAVSPLTPTGKQYAYAVDENDQPASIMVFDVSAGVTNRTPVIFPGSPRQPYSPPDRLRFGTGGTSGPSVRDVSFVIRDFPAPDPTTGVGTFGLACDPNPTLSSTAPAAQYRPNSDFSSGARPANLRGVFGFAMLSNGQIPVIDVEDFDAPCRRPIESNLSSVTDFRGCPPDAAGTPPFLTSTEVASGAPTVTGESSCNIIEPNRPRALNLSISNATVGLRAPTLRALPQFSNPDPSAMEVATDQPHLLAVDFANPDPKGDPIPAQVNISGQLFAACSEAVARAGNGTPAFPCDGTGGAELFSNDPVGALQNSLTLPFVEPRSFGPDESPSVTFEGAVFASRPSGFLTQAADSWSLQDSDASFCASGVEDSNTILTEASELGIPAADQPKWALAHADYVQITGDFLPDTDVYWAEGHGKDCAGILGSMESSFDACDTEFGNIDDPTALKASRELTIVKAYTDHLVVTPRNGNTLDAVKCCFPSGTAYTVRASHQWIVQASVGLNDIAAAADGSCTHTAACDPRKKFYHSRVFEVCDSGAAPDKTLSKDDQCVPGAANIGCIRAFRDANKNSRGAIEPGEDGSACIFENLTSRFVVYRGAQPSTRDMFFSWSTTGGFSPLAMSLATQSTSVNPQSMAYIPELGYLAVVDGSTLGLSLFDLNSLAVVSPSPFF